MENWAKNFRKVCPKTCSKHVWRLLGTILGIFGVLKKIFENFRKLDPAWNTGHKIFFRKNHPKTRLDTFGNTFGHFWNFENVFFENFRKLDPPRNTGQKAFRKICPKTCSKHVWILLRTLLGIFGILKMFFLKIFENSTLHGTLSKKIFRKI